MIVLIFIKAPIAGQVKTRLARDIGVDEAARLYAQWADRLLNAWQPLRPEHRLIGYITGGEMNDFARWEHFVDEFWQQPSGDLGERLELGFERGFREATAVAAVGTDCLDLAEPHFRQVADLLVDHQVVIGPAEDGGYYLMAMRRFLPELFRKVRWSTEFTLADTLQQAQQLGVHVAQLEMLSDIDTATDWQRYLGR